jgi:hypothetical protein
VRVDGKTVGEVEGMDTPGQFSRAGTVKIESGRHTVHVFRGGGSLAPGDGAPSVVGPAIFERTGAGRSELRWIDPDDARELCGTELDWVELARR